MYTIFVNDVAKYRGVSPDRVLNVMADGKMFIGKQAIDAGLVDGVSTFDRLLMTKEGVAVNAIQAWKNNPKLQKKYNYNFSNYLATIDLDSTPLH
jgi:ClpP class serine protease